MKSFRSRISVAFLFVAIFGTMLSMLHYHSEGLECLHHAEQEHYTENELLCPVSGIVAVNGAEAQPQFNDLILFPDKVIIPNPLYLTEEPFTPLLGRAPPVSI